MALQISTTHNGFPIANGYIALVKVTGGKPDGVYHGDLNLYFDDSKQFIVTRYTQEIPYAEGDPYPALYEAFKVEQFPESKDVW